jgi:hypothetical protein
MKTTFRILGLLLVLSLFTVIFPKQSSAQGSYFSYQVFYDQLSPYGQWVDFPRYGYVWIPDAGPDFFPYSSGGHWIMTEYGWTWLSDYDWGWAPFHYGRWDYDNSYGWYWIPDNEWGPAWVTWLRAPGYYGWTPMGPGMNVRISFGNDYNIYNNQWIFARERYFGRNNINHYYASQNDYDRLLRSSTVITNTYIDNSRHTTYISGPGRDDVQRATGRRVNSYAVHENNVPGQSLSNGQVRMYRPQVRENNDNEKHASPSRVTSLQDVRKPSERNAPNQQGYKSTDNRTRRDQQQVQVNRQNTVDKQNATNRKNAASRQNEMDQQNALNRQNAVKRQNATDQQNTLNQQEAAKRQNEVNRQNAENNSREQQQDIARRQYAIDQQKAVDQRDAANRQNTVNRQNDAEQQKAVAQQNAINRQNAAEQQKAANQQNAVNRQNAADQKNTRNNERGVQQQNVRNTNNDRREQQSKNVRSEDSGKSKSDRN